VVTVDLLGDRFNPAKNSSVFSLTGETLAPPTNAERRVYTQKLRTASADRAASDTSLEANDWRKFVERSQPELNADGQPILRAPHGTKIIALGVARSDLESEDAPLELQRDLLVSRLRQTLEHSRAPRISSSELREDWVLLDKISTAEERHSRTTAHQPGELTTAGNPPRNLGD
jgi:hypothetical protein